MRKPQDKPPGFLNKETAGKEKNKTKKGEGRRNLPTERDEKYINHFTNTSFIWVLIQIFCKRRTKNQTTSTETTEKIYIQLKYLRILKNYC